MKTADIRESFLAYFESKGHKRVASSSVVPKDDPTLLFVNAGMNQFKDVFLGQRKLPYSRATSSQKCIRAGGKHNDLENVGEDARHQTFFEMLGNFSFGDYFKEEAIAYAWDYVTNHLKLDPSRLWASVYEDDDDAYHLWEKIAPPLKNGRILRFGEKENFWSMGDTGPCGPDSELHYDRGAKYSCGKPTCGVNCECDRFMEFWNLVFMQYNRDAEGKLTPLPKPSVDTGAGLERIAMLMQQVDSNYDTDLFTPLLKAIVDLTGKEYFDDRRGVSHRVIADHIRSLSFAIADGAMPSNEGRGYVLRRILRRASRHGRLLDKHEPFIYKLTSILVDTMGKSFPEIATQAEHVALVIKSEEESFGETLDRGMEVFDRVATKVKSSGQTMVPGDEAFKLYDTYGFPVDMTEVMAREQGLTIDLTGFERALTHQRETSKAARADATTLSGLGVDLPVTLFIGYDDHFEAESKVIYAGRTDDKIQLVLEQTPFYGESGGQIGDTGVVIAEGAEVAVAATKRIGDTTIHLIYGYSNEPSRLADMVITARVDGVRQKHIQRNHTATHLLHKALRTVLGEHVQQKGSLVAPDHFRFDFSHFKHLSEAEISEIEKLVNEQIMLNRTVKAEKDIPIDEAKKRGAIALFGEKYGDSVRMVSVMIDVEKDTYYSRELCGGTHVQATGEIGLFTITSESAIAAGIRRIEGLTGHGALNYFSECKAQVDQVAQMLKLPTEKMIEKIAELLDETKKLRKELDKTQAQSATSDIEKLYQDKAIEVRGVKIVLHTFESKEQLNAFADYTNTLTLPVGGVFFNAQGQYAVMASGTAIALGMAPKTIIAGVNTALGGKGGGREYFTQGSCGRPLDEALVKATVMPIIEKAVK